MTKLTVNAPSPLPLPGRQSVSSNPTSNKGVDLMLPFIACLIGLVLSVGVSAEPLVEGRIRLSSGLPAAGVQVRLFDLSDLRQSVGTTTDATGYFALSLQTLFWGKERGPAGRLCLGAELPQSIQSFHTHSLPTASGWLMCGWKCSICWGSA